MKRRELTVYLLILAFLASFVALPHGAWALGEETITVGKESADFATISEAVNAAPSGSTIFVKAGTYKENLVIDKSLKLSAAKNTVIDGKGRGHVVKITGNNVTFRGFTLTGSGKNLSKEDAGIYVSSNHNLIINNKLIKNTFGIYLAGGHHNRVENNLVLGNEKINEEKRGNGIHLWNSEYNTLKGNTVQNTRDGLYFSFANHNQIINNKLIGQRYGVHYMYSNENTLKNNEVKKNHVGVVLMFSHNNQIVKNVSSYNKTHGIVFKDFDDNVIEGNVLRYNQRGMFIYNSQRNKISKNLIEKNKQGVHIAAGSQDNQFWQNNFIQNTQQVYFPDRMRNNWDNGSVGNYWSDYTGVDLDGNNIGEFPHWPEQLVEELVAKAPLIKLLYSSPILQTLQKVEKSFPVLRPNSTVDNFPLMAPTDLGNNEEKAD